MPNTFFQPTVKARRLKNTLASGGPDRLMRVLLAPLFFRLRVCKHCARLFYAKNPESWLALREFESLPPLGAFDTRRGFIPDFPTLLMFDEFVVDGEAFELMKRPGRRLWLREWSEVVAALASEGALAVAEVGAAANANSHGRSTNITDIC